MRKMKTTIRYVLLAFAVCLAALPAPLAAQLKLSVNAPASVDINEPYFQIRYSISASANWQSTPAFGDFDVLAGPSKSFSQSTTIINGKHSSNASTTFTFTLAPRKQGSYTIPAAEVTVDGKTYRSESITIKVTGTGERKANPSSSRSSRNSSGDDFSQLRQAGSTVSDNDLYVRAVLGRKEVYEQEAVPLSYKFYERPGIGLSSVALNKKADFQGIVSQDIPLQSIVSDVTNIGGQAYRTGIVQQYLLFPQQTGKIAIPSLTFDCVVMQRDASIDPFEAFFNGGGHISKSVKRIAPETYITVKPLPTPRPAGFSGGVGKFKAKAELLNPDVRTNEMMTYRITVSGTGNLKMLTPTTVTFPSDFDHYSPKTTDNTKVSLAGVSGSVSFDYTFVPRNIGQYEIPAFDFIYFDPAKEEYITINVPALKLNVQKGTRTNAELERERALRDSDIRDIHTQGSGRLYALTDYMWWNTWSYWLLYVLIAAIAAGAIYAIDKYRLVKGDTIGLRRHKAASRANRRLKKARAFLKKGDKLAFYDELSKSLQTYLSDKLNLPVSELNRERIQAELTAAGVPEASYTALCELMDECEYVRFAPSAVSERPETTYDRAVQLITDLDRQVNRTAHASKTASGKAEDEI